MLYLRSPGVLSSDPYFVQDNLSIRSSLNLADGQLVVRCASQTVVACDDMAIHAQRMSGKPKTPTRYNSALIAYRQAIHGAKTVSMFIIGGLWAGPLEVLICLLVLT